MDFLSSPSKTQPSWDLFPKMPEKFSGNKMDSKPVLANNGMKKKTHSGRSRTIETV
jgi:hypothetical protein